MGLQPRASLTAPRRAVGFADLHPTVFERFPHIWGAQPLCAPDFSPEGKNVHKMLRCALPGPRRPLLSCHPPHILRSAFRGGDRPYYPPTTRRGEQVVGDARRGRVGWWADLAWQAGDAHGGRERAEGASSAWRPVCRGPLRVSPPSHGALGGLGALVGVPARPGTAPSPPRKGHEEATALVGRSGKAQAAGTRTSSGFRETRAAGPAPSHFLRDRARQGPGGPLLGPQAPGLVRAPRSQRPPLTPRRLEL